MAGSMVFAVNEENVDFDYGRQHSASLVSDALPVVMLWLQQTMVRGNMQNDAVLRSNQKLITLRRSTLHYKLVTNRPANPSFHFYEADDLFAQFKLKEVRLGSGDLFDFSVTGEAMSALPGYYLLYVRSADNRLDHAFGCKFTSQAGNYFFDPNAGLFHYNKLDDLLLSMTYLNTTSYYDFLGGQYWFKQLILG